MTRRTLFRCGTVHHGIQGAQPPQFEAADAVRPAGRVGRTQALYCAPDLRGLARWYSSHLTWGLDLDCHELTYTGPEPYAYPVDAWDLACAHHNFGRPDPFTAYWQTGIPLGELLAGEFNGDEWEVLADPAGVTIRRPVSDKRIVLAADERTAREIEIRLWPRRVFHGRTLRTYAA